MKYNSIVNKKEKSKKNEVLSIYSNKEKNKIVENCIDRETELYDINISYGGDKGKIQKQQILHEKEKESYFKKRIDKSNYIETKRMWNYNLSFVENEYRNEWTKFVNNYEKMCNKAYLINYKITKNEDYEKQIGEEGFHGDSSLENIYKYAFIPFITKEDFISFIKNHTKNNSFTINGKDFMKVRYICPICLQIVVTSNMISHFFNFHYFSLHLIYWTDISRHIEHYVNEQIQNKFRKCMFYIKYFTSLYYFLYKYKENNLIFNDSLREKLEIMKKYINTDLIDKLATKQLKEEDAFSLIKLMECLYIEYFKENLPAAKKNRIFREKIKFKDKKKKKNNKNKIEDMDEDDDESDEKQKNNINNKKNNSVPVKRKNKRNNTNDNIKRIKSESETDEIEDDSDDNKKYNKEKKKKKNTSNSKLLNKKIVESSKDAKIPLNDNERKKDRKQNSIIDIVNKNEEDKKKRNNKNKKKK